MSGVAGSDQQNLDDNVSFNSYFKSEDKNVSLIELLVSVPNYAEPGGQGI